MGSATLIIGEEFLRDDLRLPADSRLWGEMAQRDDRTIRLIVEHDSIPDDAKTVTGEYARIGVDVVFKGWRVIEKREPALT